MRTPGVTVELPTHGTFSGTMMAFKAALKMGKPRLARALAAVYEGVNGDNGERYDNATYWRRYPVAILAVVFCDSLHSHARADYDCDFCGHVKEAR
jgi:hypothetical protein